MERFAVGLGGIIKKRFDRSNRDGLALVAQVRRRLRGF